MMLDPAKLRSPLDDVKRPKNRWPVLLTAAIVFCLAILSARSFEQEKEIAIQVARAGAEAALERYGNKLRQIFDGLASELTREVPPRAPFIKRIVWKQPSARSLHFLPDKNRETAAESSLTKVLHAPKWFLSGAKPPPRPITEVDVCYSILRSVQDAPSPRERRDIGTRLLKRCSTPMEVREHVVQAQELMRLAEGTGVAEGTEHLASWWLEAWKELLAQKIVPTTQLRLVAWYLSHLSSTDPMVSRALQLIERELGEDYERVDDILRDGIAKANNNTVELHFLPKATAFLFSKSPGQVPFGLAIDLHELSEQRDLYETRQTLGPLGYTKSPSPERDVVSVQPWPGMGVWLTAEIPRGQLQRHLLQRRILVVTTLVATLFLLTMLVWLDTRRIRQLKRIDALRTEFVGRISHQFRTPLTSMQLYAETLLQRELPPPKKEKYLRTIALEAARLGRLTHRMLNSSRIEHGRYTFEKEPFDFSELIHQAASRIREQKSFSLQQIETRMSDDLPPLVGDRQSLEDVLDNLLENAVKYSLENCRILVTLVFENNAFLLQVEDNGPGIPAELRERVFEKYYRARDELSARITGTGLGLAIVKRIVEAHAGTCEVGDSVLGGARFSIRIPQKGE